MNLTFMDAYDVVSVPELVGRNEAGEQVSSGTYFYTIQAGEFTATKKMAIAE